MCVVYIDGLDSGEVFLAREVCWLHLGDDSAGLRPTKNQAAWADVSQQAVRS